MTKSTSSTTFSKIQEKIDKGDVVVLTAQEICDRVRKGQSIKFGDVDVVTTATSALMSGTYAVFSFKVAEADTFIKAQKVWINDIPAKVGPCPNERIGILDLIVLGTQPS
ncbi:MAG: methanogenesis marker 16 metalloprotein, partial [Desulfobacula sp.]|nr:methanogenesis marker 16 metalloprotein [Desulfobacula sp.]